MRNVTFFPAVAAFGLLASCVQAADAGVQGQMHEKTAAVFHAGMAARARANAAKYPWAAKAAQQLVQRAERWLKYSDDQLWAWMFGNTITRSWMVWSNGHCPACAKSVPMYSWRFDPINQPWKARCPHCKALFPKNDFHTFYVSGLDEHGVFQPRLADRSLLVNVEHPDPDDPLHRFGVDDGEGYVDGDQRWRFIGAYLVYGQWKSLIVAAVRDLSAAYLVSGEHIYAHKAAVLLDRIADLYPTFDFAKEGLAYERRHGSGYVSTWHDACIETRELALAYDQIFPGLQQDDELVAFVSRQAEQFQPRHPKRSCADIRRNIESGILRDAIKNRYRIQSNYPQTDVTIAYIKTILAWPHNREEVYGILDGIMAKATAVDGVTGEKGLGAYSAYAIRSGTSKFLARFARMDPMFLRDMFARHPRLHQMFRFHIDTWCIENYYPTCGDSGAFGRRGGYTGVEFVPSAGLAPSMYGFFWQLYELTDDPVFVQMLYRVNGESVAGLPHDLGARDPAQFQERVAKVIESVGTDLRLGSVNKQEWCLGILRSGQGPYARAAWLDYDAGGGHSHMDGMNLGLYAYGLDLMPDFGYPPVNYGGWHSPRATWYKMSAAHNTVLVDGRNQVSATGQTTLWADGARCRAIRSVCPKAAGAQRYERTIVLCDISARDFYVIDVFRVVGGKDHAKFMHSNFGAMTTTGLRLAPAEEYGHNTLMRTFRCDSAPGQGWSVDWRIGDRFGYLSDGVDLHLRCTDFTSGAQAYTAEAWISESSYQGTKEAWIPRLMVRRQSDSAPLTSTFVSVIEPYNGVANITGIRRLPLTVADGASAPDSDVALEVALRNGARDLIVLADPEAAAGAPAADPATRVLRQQDWQLALDGELCVLRLGGKGDVEHVMLCNGVSVSYADVMVKLDKRGFADLSRE